jgi:lactoylglutathione lyase
MQLGYVILYVPGAGEALAFYERAFGLKRRFAHESGEYGALDTGTTALAFASECLAASHGFPYRRNRGDEEAAGFEVALVTDAVDSAYATAVANGAVAVAPMPWG